jgi:hypothetical protein
MTECESGRMIFSVPSRNARAPTGRDRLEAVACRGQEVPAVAGVRPSGAEAASVVERVTAARCHRLRNDPRYEGFTAAALAERVVGLAVGPEPGHGGWQLVGWVVDGIAETGIEVWCNPGARRVGLRGRA